jgi:hypothetical protein
MRWRTRLEDLIVCFSLSNLVFFKQWSDLTLSSSNNPATEWGYEVVTASPSTYGGLFLAISILTGVGFVFLQLSRRSGIHRLWYPAIHFGLMLLMFPVINGVRHALNDIRFSLGYVKDSIGLVPLALILWVIFGSVAYVIRRWTNQCVVVFRAICLVMAPFTIITFGNALVSVSHLGEKRYAVVHPAKAVPRRRARHRVLWNLFDETDYRLLFSERPRGLTLPALDRLQNGTFFADHAYPPGQFTAYSIPSYLSGKTVTQVLKVLPSGELSVAFSGGPSVKWNPEETIFSTVKRLGYTSAAVGWYLPYCEMLGGYPDECHRYSHYSFYKRPYQDSVLGSLGDFFAELTFLRPDRMHFQRLNYDAIFAEAMRLESDPEMDFVFIHWNIPHAPWIYDREKGKVTESNGKEVDGYVDNLALLDRTVGKLRARLESTGAWEDSTFLVSTDHNWNSSQSFDGKIDLRIPFLLKAPHQKEGLSYHFPFNALLIHDLLPALLKGDVETADEISDWIQTHAAEFPRHSEG